MSARGVRFFVSIGVLGVVAGPAVPEARAAAQDRGSIVGWGLQVVGADLSGGFVAVAAGGGHSLGLKADGSIAAWGYNGEGQCDVPAPNSGFVAIAAGGGSGDAGFWGHSLGLKADGSITAWGYNGWGQCDVPAPNGGFVAIAAGYDYSLGLKGRPAPGDLDGDLDVDLVDFGFFQACFAGPNRPWPNVDICKQADLNNDGDVDLRDFVVFQGCFNGPNRPPVCG